MTRPRLDEIARRAGWNADPVGQTLAGPNPDTLTLAAAVQAVLALHRPDEDGDCVKCYPLVESVWPCPTVRAVSEHVDIAEGA